MHRLPLEWKESPLLWDRSLPEWELFELSQKYGNVHNMDIILDIIKNRVHEMDNGIQNYENWLVLTEANELYLNDDPYSQENFLYEVNMLIFRAPINTPAFPGALLTRGLHFLKKSAYAFAISDLELYMKYEAKERMENINLFRVHGLLSYCYYTTSRSSKSRKHLEQSNLYKGLVSDELYKKENLDGITLFILNHVKQFEKEIYLYNDQEFFTKKKTFYAPFGGFNTKDDELALYSSLCYCVSEDGEEEKKEGVDEKTKKHKGIYASDKIPQGEFVLIEEPILSSFATPYAHCSYCFKHQDQMYTCFKCRYKTYCSMKCMKQDKSEHDDECLGYKYLILIMFDGTILIRLFMRLIKYLGKFVAKPSKKLRKLNTHQQVWEYLIESAKEDLPNAGPHLKYFVTKPDLKRLSDAGFVTLITYTLRLTVYVQNLTKAKEIFFNKFNLDSSNCFMLMGTMLLRLHAHIHLNSKEIEFFEDFQPIPNYNMFGVPEQDESLETMGDDLKDNENQLLSEYFNFNKPKEYAKLFKRMEDKLLNAFISVPMPEHTKNCHVVSNPLVNFMDNITNFSTGNLSEKLVCSAISDYPIASATIPEMIYNIVNMKPEDLKQFIDCYTHNFNFYLCKYFLQIRHRLQIIHQTVTTIATSMNKLNHSCIPNVKVIRLANGVLVGKALRTIKSNEELTVSYNADYLENNRYERTRHLKSLGLTCQDICCTSEEKNEPSNLRHALYCNEDHPTNVVMTIAELSCNQCNKRYTTLQHVFYMYHLAFNNEIMQVYQTKGSIRDLSIIYSCYYNFVFARCMEGNEERVNVEFKLAKFLAVNNFLQQSADMLFSMRNGWKNYSEHTIWTLFYADMMEIINIILNKVINNGLYTTLDKNLLQKLVTLGFFILHGQERFFTYNHYDETKLLPLRENMIRLTEIKEIIYALLTMPIRLKNKFFKK